MTNKVTRAFIKKNKLLESIDGNVAAKLIMQHGVTEETATELGVSLEILKQWTRSPHGKESLLDIKAAMAQHLDSKLTNLIDLATEEIADRLQNGNEHLAKDGSTTRVKVPARELAQVLNSTFDRRQLLRRDPTKISTEEEEKLKDLADRLRDIGSGAKRSIDE